MDTEDNGTWNRRGTDMDNGTDMEWIWKTLEHGTDIGTWNRHGTDMDNETNMEWTWKPMERPDTPQKQPQ